ncbi:hypothetical protein Tco_1068888 [Tanacetum coccineum]|uniref:Uncharacterized protein n=1 Tax=Tanacetum coccineum TaxID=301880 RepID=A0ABQ5HH59_9ASTR
MMADASAISICNLSQPYRQLRLILVRLGIPLLLNGNDDEYERSIIWLGYLFGSVRAGNICILAGQTLRFAAMADAFGFSTYNLSEPLRVVYQLPTKQVVFFDSAVIDLYLKLLSDRKLYQINGMLWDARSAIPDQQTAELIDLGKMPHRTLMQFRYGLDDCISQ